MAVVAEAEADTQPESREANKKACQARTNRLHYPRTRARGRGGEPDVPPDAVTRYRRRADEVAPGPGLR
jgi:hypothetical protein